MSSNVRDCPRCWVELEPVLLTRDESDVVADTCPECRGLYLEPKEVARITGHDRLGPVLWDYLDFEYDSLLVCPDCGNQMEAKDVAGVEVDVCMACSGVWFDRGELTLLSRADPEEFLVRDDHDELALDEDSRGELRRVARRLQDALGRIRDRFRAVSRVQR